MNPCSHCSGITNPWFILWKWQNSIVHVFYAWLSNRENVLFLLDAKSLIKYHNDYLAIHLGRSIQRRPYWLPIYNWLWFQIFIRSLRVKRRLDGSRCSLSSSSDKSSGRVAAGGHRHVFALVKSGAANSAVSVGGSVRWFASRLRFLHTRKLLALAFEWTWRSLNHLSV